MTIKILGSGSATPLIDRHPTSMALMFESRTFLVDCGEGTQWRLLENGIKHSKITHIFISHLHGDHYLGLVGLLSTMQSLGRKNDLYLFAPPGLKDILALQFKYQDTKLDYRIVYHENQTDKRLQIYEDEVITVETIPLSHRIPTCGFLFREKPKLRNLIKSKLPENILLQHIHQLKLGNDIYGDNGQILYKNNEYTLPAAQAFSFAFCSDTGYDENLVPQIKGIDLLYHEATFLEDKKERAKETFHSTAKQAASIALQSGVKKLIIGHFSSRYKDIGPFLEEAKSVFANTELAQEGCEFKI